MSKFIIGAVCTLILCLGGAADAVAQTSAEEPGFTVDPKLTQGEDGDPLLALEYALKGNIFHRSLDSDDSGSPIPTPETTWLGEIQLNYEGSGTLTSDPDENPTNLIDFGLSLDYALSLPRLGTVMAGAVARYEADQAFESDQALFGAHITWGKYKLFSVNDFLAFDLTYGEIDPGDDQARKAALGVTELGGYDRWDFEAVYRWNTGLPLIETIELNYRLYEEIDAPAAIEAADLDRHQLWGVRIGLPRDFFVAYRDGKLPFDRTDDQVLEAGWSYKFE